MAIQAQLFPTNNSNNNGFSVGGVLQSRLMNSHQQQQDETEQRLRQFCNESQRPIDPNLVAYNSKPLNFSPPTFAAVQLEKQREEIDQYLRFQNEKLRLILQEQGKQQLSSLLKRLESRSLHILQQKDEQILQAEKKRAELEEFVRKLEAENRAWQRMAQEKEAIALSLYKSLEEMKEKGLYYNGVVANDAESCCDETKEEEKMAEEKGIEEEEEAEKKEVMMICKSCNSRKSCFLFLPCRHISSCKVCDAFLEACPVCTMPKKASIETLIF